MPSSQSPVKRNLRPPTAPATPARLCDTLLADARRRFNQRGGGTLRFEGVGDRDVYNITAPFRFDGHRLIAGRVESRDTEFSQIVFFVESEESPRTWQPHFTREEFVGLQDPCVTMMGDELVLGGVRFPVRGSRGDENIWVMDFYRGSALANLTPFLRGPEKMKDIRFRALPDGRIAVFTRPQGLIGGRGKIGFMTADGLSSITADDIQDAPLIPGQFDDTEWGGANEVHLLANGLLGVLGHIGCFDANGHRHYYPMAFGVDADAVAVTDLHVIACRDLFPPGPAKRPDLVDVVFSGGLERHGDGVATLYAGVSDAGAARLLIDDPFAHIEKIEKFEKFEKFEPI